MLDCVLTIVLDYVAQGPCTVHHYHMVMRNECLGRSFQPCLQQGVSCLPSPCLKSSSTMSTDVCAPQLRKGDCRLPLPLTQSVGPVQELRMI